MLHNSGSLLHSNKKSIQCVTENATTDGLLLRRCQWEEPEKAANQIKGAMLIKTRLLATPISELVALHVCIIESKDQETFVRTWHYTTFKQWLVDPSLWADYGQVQVVLNLPGQFYVAGDMDWYWPASVGGED